MAQNTYNFTVNLGETHREIVVLRDDSGQRLSLRGYAAQISIKNRPLPYGYEILELSTGNGLMQLEDPAIFDEVESQVGVVAFQLYPGHIESLMWHAATTLQVVYTLHLRAPNGDHIPVLGGAITIKV